MALIACPQEGCLNRISPTARVCPLCGFEVAFYFSEDLKGYESDPSMQSYAHWIDNGDGTVTDTKQRLRWMRAPYGMSWQGGYFTGEPEQLKWIDATLRFGRGNVVEAFDHSNSNFDISILAQRATKRAGYTEGSERVYFAGRVDWRLPTISEYLYLTELRETAEGFLPDTKRLYTYFDVLFCRGSEALLRYARGPFLSATARHTGKVFGPWRLWHGSEWAYYPNSQGVSGGVIDVLSDAYKLSYCILLVSENWN